MVQLVDADIKTREVLDWKGIHVLHFMLAENRPWMKQAGAIDDTDTLILCFQSYIVKTPHHTILSTAASATTSHGRCVRNGT